MTDQHGAGWAPVAKGPTVSAANRATTVFDLVIGGEATKAAVGVGDRFGFLDMGWRRRDGW